jgi:hypothetical protein
MLMTKVIASITVGIIRSLGNKAQDKAYKHLLKDNQLKELLTRKAKESNIDESTVEWVFKRVVDYAFHARSAIEWRKYKAAKTDRTTGKSKKMRTNRIFKDIGLYTIVTPSTSLHPTPLEHRYKGYLNYPGLTFCSNITSAVAMYASRCALVQVKISSSGLACKIALSESLT